MEKIKNNIWEIKETEKVAVLDLDDVLADSIEHWINFINKILSKDYKSLNQVKGKLSYSKYKELKTYYRESGEKLKIPVKKDAKRFVDILKKKGFIVVILTRRPLYIHKNMYALTKKWLEKNRIDYDCLLFEDKKHLKIMAEIENINLFLEDNRYIANALGHWGIKCFLLNNSYNQGSLNENVTRVNNLMEILNYTK